MKKTILSILLLLATASAYADCSSERLEYERANSAYKKIVHHLWPKMKAGKKLTKEESRMLDKANARVYNAKLTYESCVNGSDEGNNFGGVDY